MPNSWTEPRTAPPTLLPAIAGAIVVLVALPLFLLAGWRVSGWAIGAVLWFGSEAFGAVLTQLRTRTGNLAAAGVVAFGMLFRAIAVMVVVLAVAVSDKWLGLAAALTYAAGYSAALGLQLVAYYTGPKAGARRVKRVLVTLSTIALLLPANAFARGAFDPTTEFEQHEWVPIHLGPLNLSITKAVVYLMLSSLATIAVRALLHAQRRSAASPAGGRRSARWSTRSPRRRSPNRACRRRRSGAGSPTWRR